MPYHVEFADIVREGRLSPEVAKAISHCLQALNNKPVHVTLTETKKKRTLKQNNYYKGIIVPAFAAYLTESCCQDVSESVADQIIKIGIDYMEEVTLPDGTVCRYPASTAKTDKEKMARITDRAIAWLAETWDFQIPLPPGRLTR